MGEASVLKRTVPTTLLFLGAFCFCMTLTSAAPFQSALRLPRDRGCYYLMKHYSNGERIETNEPCLNCTCVNSMLMCYLRICPFTKPAGPECVIRREEGECCPTVWCPGDAIPTPPPTEIPTTPEPMGCYAGGEAYVDGAQLPRNPDNPCEVCYCIRNSTACVMQECELKVEGCTPVYREPSCCPSRYNCSRYVATTLPPGPTPTIMPTGCLVNNHLYADGERVISENPCNHCYCMRDTVACAVEKCHAPGDGCIPQTVPEGQCCPDRYDCQGMEVAATDITTDEPHTTTPSIVSSESDLTDRSDTIETETPQPFSASPDVKITTTSSSADVERIELSSTPLQEDTTGEHTTVGSSEETAAPTTPSEEETAAPTSSSEKETAAPTSSSEEETAAPTSSSEKETAAPTSSSEKETAAPTRSSEKETAAPTSSSEKETAAPTRSSEEETAAPTSSSEKETAATTSSSEKETAAPTSSSEKETAAPTSFSEEETAAPTRSSEEETAAPTSSSEKETSAPTSSSEKETAAPTSSSEEETAAPTSSSEKEISAQTTAPTASPEQIIQHSTLTSAPEETHTQPGTTVSIAEEKKETTSSSSTTEIVSTELPKLSSPTVDSKITSTLLPISEKVTESGGLISTAEELEPTDLPERSTLEEKKESVSTISVEDITTISHDLSSKQPEQETTTTSYADIISSTSVPEQFESSSLAEGEETKLTAEMEGRDKVTQMITEFTDKPQSSDVSTPIISLGETTTPEEEHISLDKVTSTLAPKQETDSVHTTAASESTTLKFDTKPTQTIVVEETSSEAELFTTGTTTTSKPILPGSIPGEGNCHYATGTYQNGDAVVPVHPCEKDCVCNNSVVACDIIVCEPVSEDSTNCRIITKPDECCPYYECDPTIDQELPPALNQTKDHSIPEAVTLTSVSAETDLPERTTTEKPTATELVKLTTTKEEPIESTTERKEDLASPFSEETTKSSIVSQTEDRKEHTTEFTEPSLDERKAGTHPTDSEIEIVTTSDEISEHVGIDISSEFPSESTKLPDVSLIATSSTEGKFPEKATSVAPEGISKETTEFPIEVKVTEATSLEMTKHSTVIDSTEVTQGITEQSEKSKSEMEDHTKVSEEDESKATTLAQTQPPLETSTIKESITTTTEVSSDIESTTRAESTETLELLGDTKPAIQITNETTLSETSPSKPENELLVTTTKASVEFPEKEFDKTSVMDIVEHSTTSVPVSEETTEHPKKVNTEITTSEETVKTEDVEVATTPQTISSSDASTQPPADVQTEEAVVLTEKTEETTHKPTSALGEVETTQSALTSSASESSQPQEITTKTLETTTAQSSSKEDNSFDVIHKTSSIETTSKVLEDEVTKPTISTTEKVVTGIINVETETSQETSASPPEHSFATETSQSSQSTPGDVIPKGTELPTNIPTEPEIGIEEKTTKVSLDITKSILDKTDSETILSGKETTNTVASTEFASSTQSTEIHKQTQTTTEGEKFAITDERTTLGAKATELLTTTVPSKESSKETTSIASLEEIAKTIETTSEKVVTISDITTKKVVTFTDTTAKEGVDKTTVATSQGDQTVAVSDVTDIPLVVTSSADDFKTQSILLPKPTAIEAEIKVQPDAKPPATEIIVGRYTTTTPSTIQEVDTTSEFSFSVEVITGSSPEVQDQKTEAIAFTTPKSVETTTENRKITTSTTGKVTEVQTDEDSLELVKLSTPSEIVKEVSRTSHAEEDTTDKTSESISAIQLETQSTPSQLAEEASVASTTEYITTKLQKVSEVQGETTTEKFDEISIATTTKQVLLETTVTPKYTTIATASAEEQETPTELKPSSFSEIITMTTTTPEKHPTELLFNKTENTVTETTKIVEQDTSSVTKETFFEVSTTEKAKDLEDQTTPASQLEKKSTVIENVEGTTLKEVGNVTDSATTLSEILLVTTPDNLLERTVSSITQETRKETPSEVPERTTFSAETHQPEESTSAFGETEKATTHIISEETATEVSSIDITPKVTTKLPERGETTIHAIEDTTGSISTTSEETSEKSKAEVSQTSDHTTAEVEITTLESITTKTPVDKVPELTESAFVGISEETTHISTGTKESESLDTSPHTIIKITPTVSIETTPTILTGVSEEHTSKSSDEITSTPLNEILEQTATHKLPEDVSGITSATKIVEHSEETQPGVIIESTSQSPDITTQRVEVDLAKTTSQKPLESTASPTEITSKSTEDITPESATSSVSKFTLSETTVKSTEEVISHITAEAEKSTLTTFEEIATTEPDVSKLTSKLSTEELLGVTLTLSTISTELPITTAEEETEGLSTKSEISFTETQKPDVADVTKEPHLQPEVPSEETHIKQSTIQDTSTHPVTDAKVFTKEEELLTESTVPFDHGEMSETTTQTLLETEVPSEEPQKQDITIQETSTEYAKDLTKTATEKETEKIESAFSSTVTQEIYLESTTQTHKQPEVPSEIPHKQDITIKLETTKSEPITQSTLIHEETEMAVKGQTETTVVSGELEKSTIQPLATERFPVEQETVSASKVEIHEPTQFTSLYEDGSTTLKILSHLSTAQTILDRGTSIVTELDKENVEVSTAQQIATTLRPSKTEEQEKTTEQSYWTSWFTSSVPTTHSSPEETPQPLPTTTTTTKIPTSSPKPESTDDSSEEPIFVQKGACVFNGIVYQSAEQIPRTDACEFCFCFRGDIICLHQGCPPPMTLCYEREVPGFCCPHYVCHSPKPIYNVSDHTTKIGRIVKRSVEIKGCEANGETYRVGEIMQRFSTPCLQCKCDPKGSMTCEPQKCKPQEPLLLKLNKEYFQKRQ